MATKAVWLLVCALGVAATSEAGGPRNCATPASTFRHYHGSGRTDEAGDPTAFRDEISVCRTGSGSLAFALSVIGEKGDQCYAEGVAKPRQKDVFIFLDGGFRLRLELVGDRVRVSERSEPGVGKKYCSGPGSIGDLELKRHSGPALVR